MGSGRLPKKRTKKGVMKAYKLEVAGGPPLYFEAPSAAVDNSGFVYPFKNRGLAFSMSNYSSLLTLQDLWNVLSKKEKDFFRKTAIGHLMDIPKEQCWSSAIFWFLMSRQINVDPERSPNEEMYFRVADKELCFRKTDFALISGLRFPGSRGTALDVDTQSGSQPEASKVTKQKYFSQNNAIVGQNLYDFLFFKTVSQDPVEKVETRAMSKKFHDRQAEYKDVEPIPCPVEDRVKVALVYVVNMFLLGTQDIHGIADDLWHLVDNLSEFNNHPWGERVYRATLFESDSAIKSQMKKETAGNMISKPTVKPKGMPQVLVVWFLSLLPDVRGKWGVKNTVEVWRPLILDVLCTEVVRHQQLCESVACSEMRVGEDIKCYYNDMELLEILGVAEGPLRYKQWEDLVAEGLLRKYEGLVPGKAPDGMGREDEILEDGKREDLEAEDRVPGNAPDVMGQEDDILEDGKKKSMDSDLGQLRTRMNGFDTKVEHTRLQQSAMMEILMVIRQEVATIKKTIATDVTPLDRGKEGFYGFLNRMESSKLEAAGIESKDDNQIDYQNSGGSCQSGYSGFDQHNNSTSWDIGGGHKEESSRDGSHGSLSGGSEKIADMFQKVAKKKREQRDEAQSSCQDNENVFEAQSPEKKLGKPLKSSSAISAFNTPGLTSPGMTTATTPGKGMSVAADETAPRRVRFLRDVITDVNNIGAENKGKKRKRGQKKNNLVDVENKGKKNPGILNDDGCGVWVNFFRKFKVSRLITRKDIKSVNDLIYKGNAEVGWLSCQDFKILLNKDGTLGTDHVNIMLRLMRESNLGIDGQWTTIDSYFEPYLKAKPSQNTAKLNEYIEGILPLGGAKPWQRVTMLYGVVHIVDRKHWVAVRIDLEHQDIRIYDSMRPKRDSKSDGVYPEIKRIADYMQNYVKVVWYYEFDEDCPQQPDITSCGVYALKFVEHLIRGIRLEDIDASQVRRYRQEIAVQIYKKQFLELGPE